MRALDPSVCESSGGKRAGSLNLHATTDPLEQMKRWADIERFIQAYERQKYRAAQTMSPPPLAPHSGTKGQWEAFKHWYLQNRGKMTP